MADLQHPNTTIEATVALVSEPDILRNVSIPDLKSDTISPTLWYRLHVLIFDLMHFKDSASSEDRLVSVNDPCYIGEPYFSDSESSAIKSTMIGTKTLSDIITESLQERLQRRMKKRVESGDYRVCTAHDIAPILATALGINLKQFGKDEGFTDFVGKNGLQCGEEWKGLGTKTFAPKQKKKKR